MELYPFSYDRTRPFIKQTCEWIVEVLYERLPKFGFEVREEQIYMAYQLERAFAGKQTIFAEVGVGTGKTLVYLLYAICYSRYMRKPAIIACADESLIEQLVKPEGDIAKLTRYLDMAIDARLAKSPDQYICLTKLDEARLGHMDSELYKALYAQLPEFVRSRDTLQSFYAYGDRKEVRQMNDEQWEKVSWDAYQDCFVCPQRHRCGQTLSRDHYRRAADLIICSHDFYMEHIWTYEGRKRGGQLPLLPEHSTVIFDEGHLLESAAQKALSYKLKHVVFEELITRLLRGEIRHSLAVLVDEAIDRSEALFDLLERQNKEIPGSDRKQVLLNEQLLHEISLFCDSLEAIEEELILESELYTLNQYHLRIVQEHMAMMQKALGLFRQSEGFVCWVTESITGLTLEIMPRAVKEVLRKRVFSMNMPIVFTSSTLSVNGSFAYVTESLGIESYLSFSVDSSYDYEHQMEVIAPRWSFRGTFSEKMRTAIRLLERSQGSALILFSTKEALRRFKSELVHYPEVAWLRFGFEGDREISGLIADFQHEESSVLCAVSLWEGLDVPGPSLSNVIMWTLPFPPQDPVFMAKREAAASPYEEVDLPYMLLRLKQGMGRLIRSREDHGTIAILSVELHAEQTALKEHIKRLLPPGVTLQEFI